jgi:hypothetical protein
MRSSLRTKLTTVAAALLATAFTGAVTASGAQAAPQDEPPTGWKMVVHQMSSGYLFPDWYTDTDDEVQVWNGDLVPDQGYKWLITRDSEHPGTYRIRTNPHKKCLTIGSSTSDYVKMRDCTGSTSQSWYIRHVPGTTSDWAIVPYSYDDYAIRPGSATSPTDYVYPRQMWGGQPDLTHAWRFVDPPRGR